MIDFARPICTAASHKRAADLFVELLPGVERVIRFGFRNAPRWHREELIADAIAVAYKAFARLVELGKAALAFPTVLGRFAIRHVRSGRRVGTKQNRHDVMSVLAQRRHGFQVQRLIHCQSHDDWEQLTADRRASPADVAVCRLDFRSWLAQLQSGKRRVALFLAGGATTKEAAQRFQLSAARISQLRHELADSWRTYQALPAAV